MTTDPPVVYVLKIPPPYGLERWNFCGVKVKAVVVSGPEGAWRRYRKRGAIESMAFNAYYAGSKKAVCLEIEVAHRLELPIDPYKTVKGFRAPQSFNYLRAGSRFIPSRP